MSRTVERNCDYCSEPYQAVVRELNRGNGIYCSRTCSTKGSATKKMKNHEPNVTCAYCNTPFYKSQSKQGNSKSGLFFCSREHKDLAQRLSSDVPEIRPPHYGSGHSVKYRKYRELDMSNCSRCGYDTHPEILQVNHIDCDRSNNKISNLEVLCPNCHMEFHFTTKTGPWRFA